MSLARSRMRKSLIPFFFSSIASAMPPKPQPMMTTGTCLLSLLIASDARCSCSMSLRLDLRVPGDAAIKLEVVLELVAERFRRAADQFEIALADEVLHFVVCEYLVEGLVEFHNHIARRIAWHHDALPADEVEAGHGVG